MCDRMRYLPMQSPGRESWSDINSDPRVGSARTLGPPPSTFRVNPSGGKDKKIWRRRGAGVRLPRSGRSLGPSCPRSAWARAFGRSASRPDAAAAPPTGRGASRRACPRPAWARGEGRTRGGPSSPEAAAGHVQPGAEGGGLGGLDQVDVEAGREGALSVLGAPVTRQRDQKDPAPQGGPQPAGQLIAVQ